MLKVNLLPKTLQPKMVLNLDTLALVILIITAVVCSASYMIVSKKAKKAEADSSVLQSQADDQNKLIEELKAIETKRDLSSTQSLIASRKKWNPFLKELTYLLPSDVWLTRMIVKSEQNVIDMEVFGLAPSQKAVNRFLGRLERAPSYQNVRMKASNASADYVPVLYTFDFAVTDVFGVAPRTVAGGK